MSLIPLTCPGWRRTYDFTGGLNPFALQGRTYKFSVLLLKLKYGHFVPALGRRMNSGRINSTSIEAATGALEVNFWSGNVFESVLTYKI